MGRKIKHAKKLDDLPRPYHVEALAEMQRQTARGLAIVGSAYLDIVLRSAIMARLRGAPVDILDNLFENRGPLQDFAARIQFGYALGIYKRRAYSDLSIIKDIRNAFAHSAERMTFNHAEVKRLCARMWLPKTVHYAGHPTPKGAKGLYIRAVELLADYLYADIRRVEDFYADAERVRHFTIATPLPVFGADFTPALASPQKQRPRSSRGRPNQS